MTDSRTDLDSFIDRGARQITPRQLHDLHGRLDELRESFTGMSVPGYPQVEPQLRFLARVLEEAALGREHELTYYALSEAIFAISYLTKEVDLIPDFVADIGLTDDAAIVALVIVRHLHEFMAFARSRHIPWEPIAPAAITGG